MSTRGCMGFRLNEKDYLVYNHSDSYPSWLGFQMENFIISNKIEYMKEQVARLKAVSDDKPPTKKQIEELKKFANLNVGGGKHTDWYSLLRETQGNPFALLEAGYYEPYHEFMQNSLFCEYAYVINLDTEMLEFYKGFQEWTKKNSKRKDWGRYWPLGLIESEQAFTVKGARRKPYGPVKLISEIPLRDITTPGYLVDRIDDISIDMQGDDYERHPE